MSANFHAFILRFAQQTSIKDNKGDIRGSVDKGGGAFVIIFGTLRHKNKTSTLLGREVCMLFSSPVAVIVLTLLVSASPASTIQFPGKLEM